MDVYAIIFTATGFLLTLSVQVYVTRLLSRQLPAIQESLEAIMHGQEHIAELAAEVLRRTPHRT